MFTRLLGPTIVVLAAALVTAAPAAAQPAQPTPQPKVDYADPAAWLCRPGRAGDVCGRSDQDATVLRADGSTEIERFHADPKAPIDCFYVYPTVSLDPGGNASMAVEKEEVAVINQQFARFASVCRPYAPLYRQVTLTALRSALRAHHPVEADREMAYGDVKAAWDHYLAHDNHGRGVVLIGHSQGSLVLAALVKQEIDGKPIRQRIVSVILAGYFLQVPVGKDVGGDFKSIPLCRAAGQTGCAINFASYRSDSPPPANARFGFSTGTGMEAACTNPASLGGGSAELHAYLAAGREGVTADGAPPGPWTDPPKEIATPFVELPGLLSAECRKDASHSWLSIELHPTPGGARTNIITGDVMFGGFVLGDWGLHRIDMNLAMGDLVDIVRAQGRTWLAKAH
jgi:hypothetical protein